jgi:hypothetical protein
VDYPLALPVGADYFFYLVGQLPGNPPCRYALPGVEHPEGPFGQIAGASDSFGYLGAARIYAEYHGCPGTIEIQ